ncbi:sialate O-acetylesterase [Sphingobacterium oryzagri]|uniref:Sialate O-acetylesterase n=1 Tax=Sphingobacterium oryzagri TaxID=3025669 RepID=A0ABY7WHI5_9SPHI|nr:sialate O-acetylesterase [Sphingobacterium sp. KACC 22765]WDF69079.1 sialate O-acetylesterase [Sphingobacterium sp. KACC 22765]
MKVLVMVIGILGSWLSAQASLQLPNIFAQHMVLQRNEPVAIFGQAKAGEKVTVTFNGQVKHSTANNSGDWKVMLSAMDANAQGQALVIRSTDEEIVFHDVLVGEVWLCSGQSNMEFQMRKLEKLAAEGQRANFPKDAVKKAKNPAIRLFLVRRKFLAKPDSAHAGWSIAQDSALRQFSAAGYFFAKTLQEQLQVPVGIISSAVSGSRIEPWIAAKALQEERYFQDKKIEGDPGKFFESMIAPLAPYTIKGVFWYQGETNVFLKENISYAYKFKTLIQSWRARWGNPKLPFFYTQIAPFQYSLDEKGNERMPKTILPEFREAQDLILQLPHTGRIVTTDLVDDVKDLHPTDKWDVGYRLALQALEKTYGKAIESDGPTFAKVQYKAAKAIVRFDHAQGLKSVDGKSLSGFEVAGPDGKYSPARAQIVGQTVHLTGDALPHIVQVRFAWDEAAQPNLVNSAGLPALPFRTDNPYKKLKLK